ncbi:hypothetical protein CSUNSWCD_555 [Campylobacter showae CSUNSWCD]|uniref:Uncharacterized protein n=1 Tax=Campylobacter showae CSUNSWCD TaxID=1244083 RepID=M5IP70_9BACT|nr:hypothetical protein CSUNSWCD_555 [Campylobacter showae CSUNSWCD]
MSYRQSCQIRIALSSMYILPNLQIYRFKFSSVIQFWQVVP